MKLAKGLEKLEMLDIESIKHDPKNAKIHTDKQIQQLARIIETEGFTDPIVIGYLKDNKKDSYCVSGNGRLLALKELSKEQEGYDKVPVSYLQFNDDSQRKSFALKHNAIQQETGFDKDIIQDLIKEIETHGPLEYENLKELNLKSIETETIEALQQAINKIEEEQKATENTFQEDYSNKNKEIDIDNIDTSNCQIILKYDGITYESILYKMNSLKESRNIKTNELLILELLENAT